MGNVVQLFGAGFLVSHLAGKLGGAEERIHFLSPFLEFFKFSFQLSKYSLAQ